MTRNICSKEIAGLTDPALRLEEKGRPVTKRAVACVRPVSPAPGLLSAALKGAVPEAPAFFLGAVRVLQLPFYSPN
jgi:hypothetical protein